MNTSIPPIVDAAARAQALDPTRSFCVQAPAGSGKTELLTQRILKLLSHCEQPEDILAFTFTRKAAAEMRARLLERLEEAATISADDLKLLSGHKKLSLELAFNALQRDKQLKWNLLENSRRLRIYTIDGFCSYLTGRLPLAAGFGAKPEVGTDMDKIFEQAIRSTLDTLNQDSEFQPYVTSLLRHLHADLNKAQTLLLELLYKRDQWLHLAAELKSQPGRGRHQLEATLAQIIEDLSCEARTALEPFQQEIMALLKFAAQQLQILEDDSLARLRYTQQLPAARSDQHPQWQMLARFFLVKSNEKFLSKVTRNHGFPAKSATKDKQLGAEYDAMKLRFAATVADFEGAGLLPLFQRLATMPPPAYSDQQWDILADIVALLPLLAANVRVAMQQAGITDHTETSFAAMQALGTEDEPTDLALGLDYRITHILVDEFQDTSSLQFSLLQKLTAGWSHNDGKTLFIVGDGMQSCYAFRNANVGLFLKARDEGIGDVHLDALQLEVNFRSNSRIVEWVNQTFSTSFPAQDELSRGGVSYNASVPSNPQAIPGAADMGVHCDFYLSNAEEEKDNKVLRAQEAKKVAERCTSLLQDYPDDTTAILVRKRSDLSELVPALRQAGLKWNAQDIDPLLSYPPITDLFALLRALINLADTTAWFAIMRSPFIGLSLSDLEILAVARAQDSSTLYSVLANPNQIKSLSADGQHILARVVPLLTAARLQYQKMPLAELLENLWLSLGGPACLNGTSLLDNINTFFRKIESAEKGQDIEDIDHFEKQLQRCFGSTNDNTIRLQIMTIHKAKGLEFDHVLLPGLERIGRAGSKSLLAWQEYVNEHSQSLPILGLASSKGDDDDPLYSYINDENKQRNSFELTRLMYIAVTRASRSAWLSGCPVLKNEELVAPTSSLLGTILPAILAAGEAQSTTCHQVAASTGAAQELTVKPTSLQTTRLPLDWRPDSAITLHQQNAQESQAEETHDALASVIGELIHLQLHLHIAKGLEVLPQMLPALWKARLRPLVPDDQALEAALNRVRQHLFNCINDPLDGWIWHPQTQDQSELALIDYSSPWQQQYVIDRTFVDTHGNRWIIDYKSSLPAPGQSIEEFINMQVIRYEDQLQTYTRLLATLYAEPVRVALYFTALPKLHEI